MQIPLSMLFFEFSCSCVNAVQLHVNDARPLLPPGFWQSASDNRLMRGQSNAGITGAVMPYSADLRSHADGSCAAAALRQAGISF